MPPQTISLDIGQFIWDYLKEKIQEEFDIELEETGNLGLDFVKALIQMREAMSEQQRVDRDQIAVHQVPAEDAIQNAQMVKVEDGQLDSLEDFLRKIGLPDLLPKFEEFGCRNDTLSLLHRLDASDMKEFVQQVSERPGRQFTEFEVWYLECQLKKLREECAGEGN
ncbi:hypothetical protein NLJ89_g9945 [Agrocybe chaxingu]|uniref:Uncharacterized protein n=1 Tax=Agrocybe chaxingu TaxID=84603 RepID=A0A9W8JRI2_9AGAR|nr:hypothetical protein NLJ89_g9945 [Agrocybe chaxingu]